MPTLSFEQLVQNNLSLGFNPDSAFVMAAKQGPQAYQVYLRAARDKKPPVTKAEPVRKAIPDHWSLTKLKEMKEQLIQKSARPLSDTEAWSQVLASDHGKVLVRSFYEAHPHLRGRHA
jgi:hypothetical protein